MLVTKTECQLDEAEEFEICTWNEKAQRKERTHLVWNKLFPDNFHLFQSVSFSFSRFMSIGNFRSLFLFTWSVYKVVFTKKNWYLLKPSSCPSWEPTYVGPSYFARVNSVNLSGRRSDLLLGVKQTWTKLWSCISLHSYFPLTDELNTQADKNITRSFQVDIFYFVMYVLLHELKVGFILMTFCKGYFSRCFQRLDRIS